MRLGHIELPVDDPLASEAFYADVLGFARVANQGDRFIWLQAGAVELLLKPGPARAPGAFSEVPSLTLYTDALAERVAGLRGAGVELVEDGPCFHFQDPDGHWFQLVDPADLT